MRVNAVNVTIIESQTVGNWWAVQDTVWNHIANGMGYNATVVPQSMLDNITNLASTDVLIVSSGINELTSPLQLQTIIAFVASGRSAYIQAEYVDTYQGNRTFDSLMLALGADFGWTGTVNGGLSPMNVSGLLSTTPNTVMAVNYFNYGCAGSGTGVTAFLEYGGEYFGFCYSDSTSVNGTVVSTSDEDWIWSGYSPELLENILYKLTNVLPTSSHNIIQRGAVQIFPNPFTDKAVLFLAQPVSDATLCIYSTNGALVKQIDHLSTSSVSLQRDGLTQGVYIARVTQQGKTVATKNFAVQ